MCAMCVNVECLQQQQQFSNNNFKFICTQLCPTLIYMIQQKLDKYIERVQAAHNNH